MVIDREYGFNIGDVVYVPYMTDIPAGFYEVNAINPLWIRDDEKGSFNSTYQDFSNIKLICRGINREDV